MGNSSGFGIGTYQPTSGGVVVGSGFPTVPFSLHHPSSGVYGGTYGFVLDTTIRAPSAVQYTPAQEIGLDGYGSSVIRGFPQLMWGWNTLRPDLWYQFQMIFAQAYRTTPGFQGMVLLQYPDPAGTGTLIQKLARMDPPIHGDRIVSVYEGVQLKFTYIGQAVLNPGTPVTVLS